MSNITTKIMICKPGQQRTNGMLLAVFRGSKAGQWIVEFDGIFSCDWPDEDSYVMPAALVRRCDIRAGRRPRTDYNDTVYRRWFFGSRVSALMFAQEINAILRQVFEVPLLER